MHEIVFSAFIFLLLMVLAAGILFLFVAIMGLFVAAYAAALNRIEQKHNEGKTDETHKSD